MSVKELIEKIQSGNDNVRGDAWQNAGTAGPEAVKPLVKLMAEGEMEVARSAKRAIGKIVVHVGRPGAQAERKPVLAELLAALRAGLPIEVHRELLWMVSELAWTDEGVDEVAAFLKNSELREDARMVLERIPGDKSLGMLKTALEQVPEEFKIHVVQSLRARGVEVPGHPCQKLVPSKEIKT
jgi:hypothetical protein